MGRLLLIISLVLLVILGSIALVYTTVTNQIATDHIHGTATAQTNATRYAQAITSTAAGELQATETAQVSAMMTAAANTTATATDMSKVHATATAQAVANSTTSSQVPQTPSYQNPDPLYRGTLSLNDPLINNSQGHNWEEYILPNMDKCQFVSGTLESIVGSGARNSNVCMGKNTDFTNFAFQVQMTLLKGNCGGISFRGNSSIGFHYEFIVCSDGTYEMYNTYLDIIGSPFSYGPTPILHKGIGQTYVLAVVAIGSTISVYANYQKIATVIQTYGPHGQIGCGVAMVELQTVAIFRNAKVWVL